jgi:hypothetical protein
VPAGDGAKSVAVQHDSEPGTDGPADAVGPFIVAAIVTAVWLLGLAALAVSTANPVTLNRRQIDEAAVVISGRVLDDRGGEVAVERVWRGAGPPERLRIANLSDTPAEAGHTYVIPLSRAPQGGFVVTPTRRAPVLLKDGGRERAPDGPPAIYPATAEAHEQLERILSDRRPRPGP